MTELRDSAIWAATCDLKARVLHNAGRPIVARSLVPGLLLAGAGLVAFAVLPPALGGLVGGLLGGLLVVLGVIVVLPGSLLARNPGRLMLEADGFTYRVSAVRAVSRSWRDCGEFCVVPSPVRIAGHVRWAGRDGGPGGAFLPGAGGVPPEDLVVLLNRYRERFAPDGGTSRS